MLKLNPWDKGALMEMASACEALDLEDCQLRYLKAALEVDIKDPEVNRVAGRTLGKLGKFDDAIVCWHRVQQAKPQDEEARRAIGDLAVEKTIKHAGYEDAESSTEVMADKQAQAERQGSASSRLTPEQQLEKQIAKDPANTSLYLQLAEFHSAGGALRSGRGDPGEGPAGLRRRDQCPRAAGRRAGSQDAGQGGNGPQKGRQGQSPTRPSSCTRSSRTS